MTLLEGPAVAVGAIAGVLAGLRSAGGRTSLAWRSARAGAAAFGTYDDLAGSADRRGFRGHLGALRHGEITTGAVKLAGIGVTGMASAALAGGSPRISSSTPGWSPAVPTCSTCSTCGPAGPSRSRPPPAR